MVAARSARPPDADGGSVHCGGGRSALCASASRASNMVLVRRPEPGRLGRGDGPALAASVLGRLVAAVGTPGDSLAVLLLRLLLGAAPVRAAAGEARRKPRLGMPALPLPPLERRRPEKAGSASSGDVSEWRRPRGDVGDGGRGERVRDAGAVAAVRPGLRLLLLTAPQLLPPALKPGGKTALRGVTGASLGKGVLLEEAPVPLLPGARESRLCARLAPRGGASLLSAEGAMRVACRAGDGVVR